MALSAGEYLSGGQVCDAVGRTVCISETANAALSAGEYYSGGYLRDADGRMVICQDTLNAALGAGEVYSGGDVRDSMGRVAVAVDTANAALSANEQISGGQVRDSLGRRVIALDTLGAALSAGEFFSGGNVLDKVGRTVLALEAAAGPSLVAHASAHVAPTAAIDTTGATLLVFAQSYYDGGPTAVATDSKSNTWVPLVVTDYAGGSVKGTISYCSTPAVGTGHTFTSTTGSFQGIAVAAFKGTTPGAVADINIGNFGSGGTVQPGSATPGHAGELIVTATANALALTAAVDSGFTITDQIVGSPGTWEGVALAYLVQGAAAAVNPAWTAAAYAGVAVMASF